MIVLLLLVLLPLLVVALWIFRPPSSPVHIEDRHVFITGGSSGIGLELAKLAAAEGARKLTILSRNLEKLAEARKSILGSCPGLPVEVSIVSADVADFSSVQKAIDECGPVDVLVCSHGLAIPSKFMESSVEDMKKMVDINFLGTMHVVRAALPGMVGAAHTRSIAIFSSQNAQRIFCLFFLLSHVLYHLPQAGIFGFAAYSGTKAALVNFAQGLKQEVFQDNIQVSVIYPPDTYTPGFREENKIKPEITKAISASSAAREATQVARTSLRGIKAGKFNVPCNFDGYCLGIACAGMSPQTSALHSALEIFLSPLIRIVSIYTQSSWYGTIARLQSKSKKYM